MDPTKWILGDLSQFKEIMKEVEREVAKWEKEKAAVISAMRELESDMLKGTLPWQRLKRLRTDETTAATTRKEEIARFHRASQDTEFARMLKARTLSPEHLETQAQLRREIRVSIARSHALLLADQMYTDDAREDTAARGPYPGLQEEAEQREEWEADSQVSIFQLCQR